MRSVEVVIDLKFFQCVLWRRVAKIAGSTFTITTFYVFLKSFLATMNPHEPLTISLFVKAGGDALVSAIETGGFVSGLVTTGLLIPGHKSEDKCEEYTKNA